MNYEANYTHEHEKESISTIVQEKYISLFLKVLYIFLMTPFRF